MTDHKITDPEEQKVQAGAPEHPGGWIRRNLLEPFGLKVADAARRMDINRPGFIRVLDGQYAVSRDLAYKLEALTGVDADLLIQMQSLYDSYQDRPKREQYKRDIERLPESA